LGSIFSQSGEDACRQNTKYFILLIVQFQSWFIYECSDKDWNMILTDQPNMNETKCKVVIQYEDKSEEVILQERKPGKKN